MNTITSIIIGIGLLLLTINLYSFFLVIRLYFQNISTFKQKYPDRKTKNIFLFSANVNELAYKEQIKPAFTRVPLLTRGDWIDTTSNLFIVDVIMILVSLIMFVPDASGKTSTPTQMLYIFAGITGIALWGKIILMTSIILRRWLSRRTGRVWSAFMLNYLYLPTTSPIDDKVAEDLNLLPGGEGILYFAIYLGQLALAALLTSPIGGIVWVLLVSGRQ